MSGPGWRGSECGCPSCNGDGPDYGPDCPDSCASMQEIYSECGGRGVCVCYANRPRGTRWFWRLADRLRLGEEVCIPTTANDCDCESPAEIRADREEARADAKRGDR